MNVKHFVKINNAVINYLMIQFICLIFCQTTIIIKKLRFQFPLAKLFIDEFGYSV